MSSHLKWHNCRFRCPTFNARFVDKNLSSFRKKESFLQKKSFLLKSFNHFCLFAKFAVAVVYRSERHHKPVFEGTCWQWEMYRSFNSIWGLIECVWESFGVKWTLSRWFNFRPRPNFFLAVPFVRTKTVKTILFGIFVINHVSKCFSPTCNGIMDGEEEGKVFNIIFTLFERIRSDWKAFGVCGGTIATCELYPTIELSRWSNSRSFGNWFRYFVVWSRGVCSSGVTLFLGEFLEKIFRKLLWGCFWKLFLKVS